MCLCSNHETPGMAPSWCASQEARDLFELIGEVMLLTEQNRLMAEDMARMSASCPQVSSGPNEDMSETRTAEDMARASGHCLRDSWSGPIEDTPEMYTVGGLNWLSGCSDWIGGLDG